MTGPDRHVPEARIEAWLDGELTSSESSALDAHVQICSRCRDLKERARALRSLLDLDAQAEDHAPIRPMWTQIRDRLLHKKGGGLTAIFRPAFTLATSVATVVGIVAGLMLGAIDHPDEATEEESLWSTLESTLWQTEDGTSFSDIYETGDGIEGEEGS